jgi:surface-adhesin protein E
MPLSIHPFRRLPLVYFSGLMSLTTLLLLCTGSVYAEWVAIGSTDDGTTAYADPDTIRRKAEIVKMWILFDFKTTQTVAGHLVLSIKGQEEYDCDGKRRRVLTFSEFSGNMGGGQEVNSTPGEGTWVPVAPEGVVQTLWTFACGKK